MVSKEDNYRPQPDVSTALDVTEKLDFAANSIIRSFLVKEGPENAEK